MRLKFHWYGNSVFKIMQDFIKQGKLFLVMPVPLEIFFESVGKSKFFHPSIDLIIASIDELSIVPAYTPRRVSSIAARVSAFGS